VPRLEELTVTFRAASTTDSVARLLAMDLPKLRTLDLTFAKGQDMQSMTSTVLGSRVAPQLRALALRGSVLDGRTVRAIVKYGELLRKLERFELRVEDPGDVRRLEGAVGKALKIVYGPDDA
jgi:hypothetical protein